MVVTPSRSASGLQCAGGEEPGVRGGAVLCLQNGGGLGNDSAVMFEVTCPPSGSCGSSGNPFFADLGTDFSFDCVEEHTSAVRAPGANLPQLRLPNLTSVNGLPSIGFLKGEGPDPVHPCTPFSAVSSRCSPAIRLRIFHLGDTSGGAKGGSGGTTSCWVMTYLTQNETPRA